jgi:hypothetical protein
VREAELRERRKQLEDEFVRQSLGQAAALSARQQELRRLEEELAAGQRQLDYSGLAAHQAGLDSARMPA